MKQKALSRIMENLKDCDMLTIMAIGKTIESMQRRRRFRRRWKFRTDPEERYAR